VAVYLPLVSGALLGLVAQRLARLLPPATAAWLLTCAGVLVATATSFALAMLAVTLVGEAAPIAALGPWSTTALEAASPVPDATSVLAGLALVVIVVLAGRVAIRGAQAAAAARRLCAALGGVPGDLVVVDDPAVDAFAVPALRGRVVASRALLASLPADERRAVLAHESAHLRHHHHRHRLAVELAAAMNPLLRPLVDAVDYATERWADEDAAAALGSRAVVARALARAGLRAAGADRRTVWGAASMSATADPSRLILRVEALLAPAARRRPGLVCAVAMLVILTVAATVEAQRDSADLFEDSSVTVAGHQPGPALNP
jgi:Zn-dependent protease with chaperone function